MNTQLSNQELKNLVANLAIAQRKTDEQMKKTDEQIKELRESQKETDEQIKKMELAVEKTQRSVQKTQKIVEKLSATVGGHANNVGDVTEDFFFRGLSKRKKLGNIKYDDVRRNIGKSKEYDILMTNGDSIAVISVKYKLHDNDIDKFIKKDLKDFKKHFSEFKNYKLYAGIASKSILDEQEQKIKESGLFAITQAGKDIKILNEKNIKAKIF